MSSLKKKQDYSYNEVSNKPSISDKSNILRNFEYFMNQIL